MKQKSEIKFEIQELIKNTKLLDEELEERKINKNKRHLAILNMCMNYIETNPREDFIVEMLQKKERQMKNIETGFNEWRSYNTEHKLKKAQLIYNNLMDKKEVALQIKTLKYLLS